MPRELLQDSKEAILPNAICQERGGNWSSLHDAAIIGNENLVISLLYGQTYSTVKEFKYGNTPLHEAALRGYSRCVKILCVPATSKTVVNSRYRKENKSRETKGSVHTSILSIQNYAGCTALHLAAQNGHNQSCRELLLAGADPDVENYYGDTALHTACRYGHAGATRILLSAFCNVNKGNLNGDTPLHITCAMGRHKLTRILLEAECEIIIRNAQGETPRDMALRKGYGKILEILNNPHRMRNKRDKHRYDESSEPKAVLMDSKYVAGIKEISWSPYGCHYFPDPRAFPSPKLETLPKEPLRNGEQYYIDLAGHIRKGPIGIGNICYCGPFFKHIEDKINSNKKKLRKYVTNAKEDLGDKVKALAIRTNQQIEKLTRSMIADRVHCENRRKYLENCLSLSDPLRSTAENIPETKQSKKVENNPLKRCQSLELIDKDDSFQNVLINSRSYDILRETAIIYRNKSRAEDCKDPKTDTLAKTDFYNVSARLGSLLAKTNSLLEEPKINDTNEIRFPNNKHTNQKSVDAQNHPIIDNAVHGMGTAELDLNSIVEKHGPVFATTDDSSSKTAVAKAQHKMEVGSYIHSTISSTELAQNDCAILCNFQNKNRFEYLYDTQSNGRMLQSVISALRKDDRETNFAMDVKALNESENNHENKLGYKDDKTLINRNRLFKTPLLIDRASRKDMNHKIYTRVHKSSTSSEESLTSKRTQTAQNQLIKTKLLNWTQNVSKKNCTGEQPNARESENNHSEKSVYADIQRFQNRIPCEIEDSNDVNEFLQKSRLTQIRNENSYNILYNKSRSSDFNVAFSNAISVQRNHSKHFLSIQPTLPGSINIIEPSSCTTPVNDTNLQFQRFMPKDVYFHDLSSKMSDTCEPVSENPMKESGAPNNSGINCRCFNSTIVSNACRAYDFKLQSLCKNPTTSNFMLPVQAFKESSFANPVKGKRNPAQNDLEHNIFGNTDHFGPTTSLITSNLKFMDKSGLNAESYGDHHPSFNSESDKHTYVKHFNYTKNIDVLNDNAPLTKFNTNNISSLV